jgi:hypothetical protein
MDRYVFIHVPKTAGSSIIKGLQQVLGSEAVGPRFDAHFDEINIEQYSRYRMIVGHLRYDQLAHFPNRRILTYLRDPVDVIVSKYFFYRQMHSDAADAGAPHVRFCKELSLDEIAERQDEFKTLFNDAVWRFAAQGRHSYAMPVDEALALACERLRACDFVGIYEDLAGSVDLMSYTFSWPPIGEIPYENVTAERKALGDINSQTRQKLLKANHLDAELYQVGRELLERRKRAAWRKVILGVAESGTQTLNGTRDAASNSSAIDSERTRSAEPCTNGNDAAIIRVSTASPSGDTVRFCSGDSFEVKIFVLAHRPMADASVVLRLVNRFGQVVYGTFTKRLEESWNLSAGEVYEFIFRLPLNLAPGAYSFTIDLISGNVGMHSLLHHVNEACPFEISGSSREDFLGTVNLCAMVSKVTSPAFTSEYRFGERIDFTQSGNARAYMLSGWSTPEEWACWTDGPTAELLLRLDSLPNQPLELISTVDPFCPGSELKVGVTINGVSRTEWRFSASGRTQNVQALVPSESLQSKTLHIRFHIDRPVSPAQLGLSDDTRALGLAFRSMHIQICYGWRISA